MLRAILIITCFLSGFYANGKSSIDYVSIGYRSPVLEIGVDNQGAEEVGEVRDLVFGPKIPNIVVLGTSFKNISLSTSLDVENSDSKTDYVDYKSSLLFSWFGFDATYTGFEKFALVDATGFNGAALEEPLFLPEMKARFLSASTIILPLCFNYDLEHSFKLNSPKKTGFALGVELGYSQTDFISPDGLVPEEFEEEFGRDSEMEEGSFALAGLQLVVGTTISLGPVYMSAMFGVGEGQHEFHYDVEGEIREGTGFADIYNMRFLTGYVSKSGFLAFSIEDSSPKYELKYMSITSARSDLSLTAGISF